MMVQMIVKKSRFPIECELTQDGKGANVTWQGGSKWIGNPPATLKTGDYDEMVFEAREFKGTFTFGDLIDATESKTEGKSK
jgi:hypothetical protein